MVGARQNKNACRDRKNEGKRLIGGDMAEKAIEMALCFIVGFLLMLGLLLSIADNQRDWSTRHFDGVEKEAK